MIHQGWQRHSFRPLMEVVNLVLALDSILTRLKYLLAVMPYVKDPMTSQNGK